MGTSISKLRFQDLEILNAVRSALFDRSPFTGKVWISLSHAAGLVTASVILEKMMKASLHRPSKAVIDLAAIAFNIEQLEQLPQTAGKWAVVKANAYGHGAIEVSRYIEPLVDGFVSNQCDPRAAL